MNTPYLDTVAAYHDYPKGSIQLSPDTRWNKTVQQMGHTDVTSWWTRDNGVTVRVYNQIFGTGRIFFSTSVPKLVHGHNYWYADSSDTPAIVESLERTLHKHIQTSAEIDPLGFQLSRADVFYMHQVPPALKPLVMDALAQMGTGRHKQSRYGNTRYISCKLIFDENEDGTRRLSSVVVRVYCKDLEQFNRHYTEDVAGDFQYHHHTEYTPPNYVRVEVSIRRDAIVNRLGDKSQPTSRQTDPSTTLGAVLLNPALQAELLDEHFQRMGFYERVYSAPTFRSEVASLAKSDKGYKNTIETARLRRNNKNPNISPDALRGVRELLQENGISLVTTGEKGYDLPPVDRAALLAQDANFLHTPAGTPL